MQRTSISQPSSPQKTPPTSKHASFEHLVVPEAPKENAFIRLLVTPITFISFLFSLFLIDAHNHSLRQHSHTEPRPPPSGFFGKSKSIIHHLVFKQTSPSTSPYAYVHSPENEKVGIVGESEFSVKDVKGSEKESEKWYWRTKQKKMMRAEMEDAFRIRKWVVGFLIVGGVGGLWMSWIVLGWLSGVMGVSVSGGTENGLGRDW